MLLVFPHSADGSREGSRVPITDSRVSLHQEKFMPEEGECTLLMR